MKFEEVKEYNNCKLCGTKFEVTSTHKEYCSVNCGYKDKIANKYHCPVCNSTTYSLDHDPYCSINHKKHDINKYTIKRECRVCGSTFFTDKFTYVCSDYCKERDHYE